MPTYEYQCDACKKGFLREQRITENPIKKCPNCGKMKARRMISGGDFILKGGGWYSDLYSKPAKSAKKSDTSPSTSTETSKKSSGSETSGSSDSKSTKSSVSSGGGSDS